MKLLQNMKKKDNNKGFSLVELIIVIAIMAILVGIVGTQVIPYLNKSRESKDLQIINSYSTAAVTAYSSHAESVTSDTTVIIFGSNTDADGKPAKTLEDEILNLTSYDDADALQDAMSSKAGKTVQAVKITIDLTNKKVTAQAYSDTGCTKAILDPVESQL